MPNVDLSQVTPTTHVAGIAPNVLIGIPAPLQTELLSQRAADAIEQLRAHRPGLKIAVAYPGTEGAAGFLNEAATDTAAHALNPAQFIEYSLPASAAQVTAPWLGLAAAYERLSEIANRIGVDACVILSPDLAAFDAQSIQSLVEPVLDKRADLSMPLYAISKYEGLLNSSILYPFTRSLYGRRIRYPLGPDFAVSTTLLARLSRAHPRASQVEEEQAPVWPGTEAVVGNSATAQVHLDGRHGTQNESLDLTTVLSRLAGSLFADADKHAVVWQRIRGSQPGLTIGAPRMGSESKDVDVRPMIEAFKLASRNLQEVWGLVLPPVTLLEIKRLSRVAPEQFRITDNVWSRIVYDFALAYRLRTLSRVHLLGALTPLYLGWVASYAQEIARADAAAAEQRIEKLAKTYEEEKGYFVSRWRWPDRFNP